MRGAEAVAKGVLHESPPQGTEVAMSIYSGIYNVGIGAGALVDGSVCDGMGLRFVGYVGGGIALIALVCCLTTELPLFSPYGKSVRLDLRCRGEDGTTFIVEVQNYGQRNFFRRSVLYAAKSYDAGSRSGDGGEYGIPPVYFVGLLSGARQGFELEEPGRWVSEYTFREKKTGRVPDETINFVFLELNRFGKELEECEGLVEQWCYALKHVGTLDRLPEGLRVKAFERLFRACEVAEFSPEVKLKYESDMITERDYYNIIGTAEERGRAEGEATGIGKVAQAMLAAGEPMDKISEFTGLTAEQLEKLKQSCGD